MIASGAVKSLDAVVDSVVIAAVKSKAEDVGE
jgi:hypothetical protein